VPLREAEAAGNTGSFLRLLYFALPNAEHGQCQRVVRVEGSGGCASWPRMVKQRRCVSRSQTALPKKLRERQAVSAKVRKIDSGSVVLPDWRPIQRQFFCAKFLP